MKFELYGLCNMMGKGVLFCASSTYVGQHAQYLFVIIKM